MVSMVRIPPLPRCTAEAAFHPKRSSCRYSDQAWPPSFHSADVARIPRPSAIQNSGSDAPSLSRSPGYKLREPPCEPRSLLIESGRYPGCPSEPKPSGCRCSMRFVDFLSLESRK